MSSKWEIGKRLACLVLAASFANGCGNEEDYGFGGIYAAGLEPGPTDPAATTYSGSGALDVAGGTLDAGDVQLVVPDNGVVGAITIAVSETTLPAALPAGLSQIEQVLNVAISAADQDMINAPMSITMTYGDGNVADEDRLLILHYDPVDGYEAVRILRHNTFLNTITFESRTFSDFVLVEITAALPASHTTGFDPATNGWNIANSGSYFAPDGNAYGMSGYASWFYQHGLGNLNTKFAANDALLMATRMQISQNKAWPSTTWRNAQDVDDMELGWLRDDRLGWLMKAYMALLNEPLVLLFGTDRSIKQAAVVYGYDENGFLFYDVDDVGVEQTVTFDGATFGAYGVFSNYGYSAVTSMGRDQDFTDLTTEGENSFPDSSNIVVDTPLQDEQIEDHQANLTGSLQGGLAGLTDLYVEVKGVGRQVPVVAGAYNSIIEISANINTIVLLAGVDASTQSNWFKNAPTYIREVEGMLPASNLVVTLTWEQDGTDVDLYITEPGGETMWYGGMQTSNNLVLDFDNTSGYGPEHGTLTPVAIGDIEAGVVQNGQYVVRVQYYSDHDTGQPATGTVSIVVNEGDALMQESAAFEYDIAVSSPSEAGPGGSGATWVDIAYVDIVNSIIIPIAEPTN